MGKILSGILGGFSGKVGPVVGGKWKDINYMRSYVIPSNPNTTAQQTVREKFAALVEEGRGVLSTILQPYWDPFYSNMSGFNAFLSQNYDTLDGSNKLQVSSKMALGTLTGNAITDASLSGSNVSITWTEYVGGNAESGDLSVAVIYDKSQNKFWVTDGINDRSDEATDVVCEAGLTVGNLVAFLFFRRGTGSELVVSDSEGAAVHA